jgi:hypothetical protein
MPNGINTDYAFFYLFLSHALTLWEAQNQLPQFSGVNFKNVPGMISQLVELTLYYV